MSQAVGSLSRRRAVALQAAAGLIGGRVMGGVGLSHGSEGCMDPAGLRAEGGQSPLRARPSWAVGSVARHEGGFPGGQAAKGPPG